VVYSLSFSLSLSLLGIITPSSDPPSHHWPSTQVRRTGREDDFQGSLCKLQKSSHNNRSGIINTSVLFHRTERATRRINITSPITVWYGKVAIYITRSRPPYPPLSGSSPSVTIRLSMLLSSVSLSSHLRSNITLRLFNYHQAVLGIMALMQRVFIRDLRRSLYHHC